jgi:NAD-dependent DNA ligase
VNTEGGKLLQAYLMSSFAYYHLNRSLMSDDQFDKLCKRLLEIFDSFEHQHKYLVTKEDLAAGTGFAIKEYPIMVIHAAWHKLDKMTTL